MSTKAKVHLNNGEIVELTVFGPVNQWMEEVTAKGSIMSDEILIPVCSIARINMEEVLEETAA